MRLFMRYGSVLQCVQGVAGCCRVLQGAVEYCRELQGVAEFDVWLTRLNLGC